MATLDAPALRQRDREGTSGGSRPWWGRFTIEESAAGLWELGPLSLLVERLPEQWRLGWSRDDGRDPETARVSISPASAMPSPTEAARFAVGPTSGELTVEPALPDRDVVARADHALHVLAGQEVTLHVAVPVSLRLLVTEKRALTEVPTERLRETWRGRTTASGELCWAAPALARLDREDLDRGAHHALVAVTLHNRAEAALLVERVSVPVTHLPLWLHPRLGLLAANVRLDRDAQRATAQLEIGSEPPVADATLLLPGRVPEPRLDLVRALEAWLG